MKTATASHPPPSPAGRGSRVRQITFDDAITRRFLFASVGWGIVGMLVGVIVACQLVFHQLNVTPFLSFGRLRPLHTNAVIFAFVGNMAFAGIYYSTQRLLKTRMASDVLSKIHFWGWQLIIVAAAITLPLGISQAKEYAELEWPVDLAIAVVWVLFAVNFFWTLKRRNEKHLYVAIWFYIATIVTVAVLHVVNALSLPISPFKSYSIYGGVSDALVQWWYGHNAVAFFLTTPILGIMYYFVPKASERPVYSYRLSIVHFWALVFMYIWAGPHHLLYTALPEWAQTTGMIFSLMLWAPSWGGMINGLLTIRGAFGKLRDDPVLRFYAAGITFYGMATFEGPLLSIKSVSALAHYTDWIVGHVHGGALGWNGLMAAGMFYWLVPRLFGTKLWSVKLANVHFWLGTLGILFYIAAMWTAGITQGLMLRAIGPDGALVHPDFLETVIAIRGAYVMRIVGGGMYLAGFFLLAYNLYKTARAGAPVDGTCEVVVTEEEKAPRPLGEPSWARTMLGWPVLMTAAATVLLVVMGKGDVPTSVLAFCLLVGLGAAMWIIVGRGNKDPESRFHRVLEGKAFLFSVLTVLAVLVGGIVELVPVVVLHAETANPKKYPPYRALELEGRDVFVREGCYTCHSQMIRPLRHEVLRYGEPSKAEESVWDHPFQWGSKRTGPDLARVGTKYPNLWHYKHLVDPRSISAGSIMPSYAFLETAKVDYEKTTHKLAAMKSLGVPYDDATVRKASDDARAQADTVRKDLKDAGVDAPADSEMIALIAYLQRLGKPPTALPSDKPVAQTAP